MAEELHFHLLELARAKREIARRNLVAETLSRLRDTEWDFHPCRIAHILEVDEHSLRRFGAKKGDVVGSPQSAQRRFEHEVEFARLGELTLVMFARMFAGLERAFAGFNVIDPEPGIAGLAVDHEVVKHVVVSRALPDLRMHDDRAIEPHHRERLWRAG